MTQSPRAPLVLSRRASFSAPSPCARRSYGTSVERVRLSAWRASRMPAATVEPGPRLRRLVSSRAPLGGGLGRVGETERARPCRSVEAVAQVWPRACRGRRALGPFP